VVAHAFEMFQQSKEKEMWQKYLVNKFVINDDWILLISHKGVTNALKSFVFPIKWFLGMWQTLNRNWKSRRERWIGLWQWFSSHFQH
jgi:hypothetical protein